MTFSIAARCERTGAFGIAITTSSIAVGARCPFVLAGAGAVLTQHSTDPGLGIRGIELLKAGKGAKAVIEELRRTGTKLPWRQLAAVDRTGAVASHTGESCGPEFGAAEGRSSVAVGNICANARVVPAIVEGFMARPDGLLAERLLDALDAGLEAGGEHKPLRSATLLVAESFPFPETNLRVDWHDRPLAELRRIWTLYEPQKANYMMRVNDPDRASQS